MRRAALMLTVAALLVAGGMAADRFLLSPESPANAAAARVPLPAGIPENEPAARVAAAVGPSAVQVNVRGVQQTPFGPEEGEGIGSGVIYRSDGYIVTNAHVVEGAEEVEVVFADGTAEEGEVVGTDAPTDLAAIRVDRRGLPAVAFGESGEVTAGQMAIAIGSPSGFESTVTSGIVSGVGRAFPTGLTGEGDSALVDLVQTDAPISPGNSGGALVNRAGEVIGINVAYLPPGETGAVGLGFAIPSDAAVSVADQLIEDGEAVHPYLGVSLTDLTPETAERFDAPTESGAAVTEVAPDGPAADADLRTEDVVTAIDSRRIESSGDLLGALRAYPPGDDVELTVARDGEEIEIGVVLGEMEE